MRSFKSIAAQVWLAHIFISLIATAPSTDISHTISARAEEEVEEQTPDPTSCSRGESNPWENLEASESVCQASSYRRRQDVGAEASCVQVARHEFKLANDTIKTPPIVLDEFKRYFLSWQIDGFAEITMWTRNVPTDEKPKPGWMRSTIDKAQNKAAATYLDNLDNVNEMSFDLSLQPFERTGEVALFRITPNNGLTATA